MERNVVKSVGRTLEVLELFEEQRRPLRLHEIYEMLGYPQSSTTNLLKSMVVLGYLNYSRVTRTYLPTARVSSMGRWLFGLMYGQHDFPAMLDRIRQATDETVVLAMQNDVFIQYVTVLTPDHEFKVPPPEGTMRAMTDSSAGLALMSQMSDRKVEKLVRQIHYYELSPSRVLDIEGVMKEVRWVRHTGYCHWSNHPAGLASIAFPLGSQLHGIELALGVGGLNDRIARKQYDIIEAMRAEIARFQAGGDDVKEAEVAAE
jgi:DNA-binding IclR family transcriptional regulator